MKNMKLWDWVVWHQRLKWKITEYFMPSKKVYFFSCVYIKCFKSTKKNITNVKLKLLTKEDAFWVNRRDLELVSDVANWAQIFDKCDPKKQNYRHTLIPNTKFQQYRVFVQNDLVEKKN